MTKSAYNVTLKEGATEEDLKKAKEDAIAQGGTITNEFKLIKGFTVEFPADSVHTLASSDTITVESDGVVTTQ